MLLHEQSVAAGSRGGFRDKNQAARFPVESVYDRNLTTAGNFECQQLAQFLPQRSRVIWLGRMNEKKRRLLDDDVVIRLIDDLEIEHQSSVTDSVAPRQLATSRAVRRDDSLPLAAWSARAAFGFVCLTLLAKPLYLNAQP